MQGDIPIDEQFAKTTFKTFVKIMGEVMGPELYHGYIHFMHDATQELIIEETMPFITVDEKQSRSLEVNSLPDVEDGWILPLLEGVIIYDDQPPSDGHSSTTRRTSTSRRKNPVREKHTGTRTS